MPSTTWLLSELQRRYPSLSFMRGEEFYWSPEKKTIFYKDEPNGEMFLLHETAHGVLGHTSYKKDVQLLELEREAWEYARLLGNQLKINLNEERIQDALDTYREWLHARSTCPNCDATGIQSTHRSYKCLVCLSTWRANEARACALRRYMLSN